MAWLLFSILLLFLFSIQFQGIQSVRVCTHRDFPRENPSRTTQTLCQKGREEAKQPSRGSAMGTNGFATRRMGC